MPLPSWPLILWSGLAATCAAALLGSVLGGRTSKPWALIPRQRSTGAALLATVLAGVVAYPVLYGVAFELLARSSAGTGVALGTAHGLVAFAVARTSSPTRHAVRNGLLHLLYGVVIAFLYVTP